MLKSTKFFTVIVLSGLFLFTSFSFAQKKIKPPVRISPKAEVSQIIGLTHVSISYSRPGVKGRKIWGGLVPYNMLWRTGANEATKITFDTDVKINGKKLKKGAYAFFAIPTQKEWTLIFNNDADQWGTFTYNETKDALHIKVKPVKGNFAEWLYYSFNNMVVKKRGNPNSAVVSLNWGELKIPFTIETTMKY
ncbi:MAG TPA: DUF2911 domain-containing protein [Ignavibacteria bacterium]|nr:DUF2911 domain-containing protein [Ignavibacteria bacterium]